MKKMLYLWLISISGCVATQVIAASVQLKIDNQTEESFKLYDYRPRTGELLSKEGLGEQLGVVNSGGSWQKNIQLEGSGNISRAAITFVNTQRVGSLSFAEFDVGAKGFRVIFHSPDGDALFYQSIPLDLNLKVDLRTYKVNVILKGDTKNRFSGSSITIEHGDGAGMPIESAKSP